MHWHGTNKPTPRAGRHFRRLGQDLGITKTGPTIRERSEVRTVVRPQPTIITCMPKKVI
jgi:hypothetical protein